MLRVEREQDSLVFDEPDNENPDRIYEMIRIDHLLAMIAKLAPRELIVAARSSGMLNEG